MSNKRLKNHHCPTGHLEKCVMNRRIGLIFKGKGKTMHLNLIGLVIGLLSSVVGMAQEVRYIDLSAER
jgi:hypothetical protein